MKLSELLAAANAEIKVDMRTREGRRLKARLERGLVLLNENLDWRYFLREEALEHLDPPSHPLHADR